MLELHQQIQQGTYPNCSSFAKKWEVSSKTIQRDLDFLKYQLDAPVEYDPIKRGYYYTDPCFMLPSITMNEGELMALAMGACALEAYRGTPIAAHLEAVLEKLVDVLPDEIAINPSEIFSQFSFSAPPTMPVDPSIWEDILKGLLNKRQMEIVYLGKTSRVHPLHLANLQGEWYLFVRFFDYDNFRQIALGRIEKVTLLDESVDAVDFDIDDMMKDTLYRFAGDNKSFTVKLRFDAEVAPQVSERQWHPQQKLKLLKDGGIQLEFDAKGDLEAKRWVMAWGRYCKVLAPSWLHQSIQEEASAMLEN